MFTGLIADLGSVAEIEQGELGATLAISTPLAAELSEGDSIAVNGVCLTATAVDAQSFRAQAMSETLRRTALGALSSGDAVNLELPVRAGDRLGGHFVQGHVDSTGTVRRVREEGFSRVLEIAADPDIASLVVEKGSVAIDGVSLTVSRAGTDSFEVSLIPETLQRTNLGRVDAGQRVNIETDILAKHIARLLGARS